MTALDITLDAASTLRITHATLIDATGRRPVPDATLIADETGTIVYVGPEVDAPPLAASESVDAGGRTLLPGFFDCHVHLAMPSDESITTSALLKDPTLALLESTERLARTLDAGVTTVRDLGGLTAGFRTAVRRGLISGPRLSLAVTVLGHTGGHVDSTLPSGIDASHGSGLVDTPDEARVAVRRALRDGADVIKICTSGGMASPSDDPDDEGLREAEVAAVVDEAARHRGVPVAAHAQGLAGILAALRGGVTSVEHGYGIDDEAIDLMAEKGVFLVPTLATVYAGINKDKMAPWHYQKKTRWSGITKENIAHAIDRRATIALGTDAAISPHGENLRELSYLVDLGMSPMDAIMAGTANAAQLLRVDDRLGTLEVGKLADLILCDGDPLSDISALGDPANISLVAQQGVVRKNHLPAAVQTPGNDR